MKFKMIIDAPAGFVIGDCSNCNLAEYTDSFGELCCCEGVCIGEDSECPLISIEE